MAAHGGSAGCSSVFVSQPTNKQPYRRPAGRCRRSSRDIRARQAEHVTKAAGGSAHPDPAPGSAAHKAIRQFGVTAWYTADRPAEYI